MTLIIGQLAVPALYAGTSASVAVKVTVTMPSPSETMYIYLNGQRIASKDSTGKYFYHNDHLGGANVITDESGREVKRVDYWPYGATKEQSGAKPEKHLFTGKEFDSESGLYFYGARYYDPSICRFISADLSNKDPSSPQKFNRYSYCLNNPLIYTDPSGNDETSTSISMATYLYKAFNGTLTTQDVVVFTASTILTAKNPIAAAALSFANGVINITAFGYTGITYLNAIRQEGDAYLGLGEMTGREWASKIKQAVVRKINAEIQRTWDIVLEHMGVLLRGEDNDSSVERSKADSQSASLPNSSPASMSSNTQIASDASTANAFTRGGAYMVNTPPGTIYNLMEHNPQFTWSNIQREYQSGLTWTSYDRQAFNAGYLGITRPVQGASGEWKSQTSYFGHAIHSELQEWTADSTPH